MAKVDDAIADAMKVIDGHRRRVAFLRRLSIGVFALMAVAFAVGIADPLDRLHGWEQFMSGIGLICVGSQLFYVYREVTWDNYRANAQRQLNGIRDERS